MSLIQALIQKGVHIPNPDAVEIGDDIDVERISGDQVTIHSGCKLKGSRTFIAQGVQLGAEGPATIQDCFVGPHVALRGGFFQEAAFLEKASCGLGCHVRRGTILEEQASIAHTVGLKQTILFPYVTLGSLINFCDCLMAGGTSRSNHSEVGSAYIHFNYTPNQDKATPSLMGDVPRGVMLNQSPIFLGGQGGLVGPCQLAYGTVVAAGTICRKDQLKENYLVIENASRSARIPYKPGGFGNLRRILNHNLVYIGQLFALNQWYRQVRSRFVGPAFPRQLLDGLIETLSSGIDERIQQLNHFGTKYLQYQDNRDDGTNIRAFSNWSAVEAKFEKLKDYAGSKTDRTDFVNQIELHIAVAGKAYLTVIGMLDSATAERGSRWLQDIVDHVVQTMQTDFGTQA